MTADGLSIVQWFSTYIWAFFTTWYIPGTAMTPAQLLFFGVFVGIAIPFIRGFFNKL